MNKFYMKTQLAFPMLIFIIILSWINFSDPAKISGNVGGKKNKLLYEASFIREEDKAGKPVQFKRSSFQRKAPKIQATNAIFVDLNKRAVLFEKNADERVPVASLVKIMTAVIALEHMNLNEEILVSEKAANIGENSMGISQAEVYTLEDLLYGLILNSGNDAAVAIAEGVAGNEKTFVSWMNTKAEDLGLKNTRFSDSYGLNLNKDTYYSSAYDIAVLSEYALRKDALKKIFSTFQYEIPYTKKHKYLFLENQTNLLTTYPGVKGVKTGYTQEAGLCLVTYSENGGEKVLGVILGSSDRRGDAILMLDYSFNNLGINVKHNLL